MKTLKFLSRKKYQLVFALLISSISVDAQTATTPKNKKLQMGIFAEGYRELRPTNTWENPNIGGITTGIAFRYRLSNTFQISTGLGASVSFYGFKERDWDMRYYVEYEPLPYKYLGDERRQTLLRLPVSLQANIYKQKFYVSGGFELFKNINYVVKGTYQDVITKEITTRSSNSVGGAIDIQFCAGMGWNFNSFSLESNLKFYTPLNGYIPALDGDIFSPSLRLNWYFIK